MMSTRDILLALFVALLWVGCFLGVGLMYFKGAVIGPRHALAAMALGAGGMAASVSHSRWRSRVEDGMRFMAWRCRAC